MKTAKAYSAHIIGLDVQKITVEVDISNGLHSFSVIGLGDRSVEEAKDRIGAAIKNTGFTSPKQKNQKVVISLAPADIRKEGTSFDLAMALAYLAGAGDIDFEYEHILFLGELSLEGELRKVYGLLPILTQASHFGFTTVFIPKENEVEASLAQDIIIYPASSLREVIDHLDRSKHLKPLDIKQQKDKITDREYSGSTQLHEFDISLIRGNETAKRALEIAVAGSHNIMLYGPPGTGKTMLAKSVMSIMPSLTYRQAVEITGLYSIARILKDQKLITDPPFRSPHHTASSIAMLGGGVPMKPGEISLAHRGVLFMDEFPEFDREVIDGLRQPLEDRTLTLSRARGSVEFPAQCILIATMNPCRCGRSGDDCTCSRKNKEIYRRKIPAPILDRIDMWIEVDTIDYEKLSTQRNTDETSINVKNRIILARRKQKERFCTCNTYFNGEMGAREIEKLANIERDAIQTLKLSAQRLKLSSRAFHRVIKVARTIADLDDSMSVSKNHILEALNYRHKM